ncbi:hypothetical protein FHL15_011266 [Xylaria flabelliformis]|uniref:Rhodopsin domain-containing protein n=1 Tax=Xylaria flabelliformis TaxID=2512241 RepID=A0A553HIT2_9PEZI|nr:hypothetical protein FHL15_011266 [Xylaria flabelliformis]
MMMSDQMPALDPPEGVLSNFQNPPTRQPLLIIASTITLLLTLGGIGARTYTRAAIMRKFDSTDSTSAINVVSDFTILITPLASIWQLQMPTRKKMSVAAVFGVGVLANVTSIIRLYYSVKLTRTIDITWAIVPVASWALGEFTTVILVACFPYFPRLFQHFFPKNKNTGYLDFKDSARSASKSGNPGHRTGHWHDSSTALAASRMREDTMLGDGIRLENQVRKASASDQGPSS